MFIFKQLFQQRDGAAAAEMALISPLLIILMFGSFELGHYFWSEHKVVKAVRDGARYAGRQPFARYPCTNSTQVDTPLSDTALETRIKNITRTGTINGSGEAKVPGWDNTEVVVTFSCPSTSVTTGIYEDLANAPRVKVVATVPYPSLFGAIGFDTNSLNVIAQAQAPVMGI